MSRIPDQSTIPRFRHLLEEHGLGAQILNCVNAQPANKGNQWHFGMKAQIGVDADSGLVQTVIGTPANVNDVNRGHRLLHGEEALVFADAR